MKNEFKLTIDINVNLSEKVESICVLFTKPTHKPLYGGKLPTETVMSFVENMPNLR